MKQKFLVTLTLVTAIFSSVQVLAANFSDINNVPWDGAKTYINSVADTGIMVGDYNHNKELVFRAKDGVSYCETMQLLYSLVQKTDGQPVSDDIKNKWTEVMNNNKIPSWVQPAVAYGLENSIIMVSDIEKFVDAQGSASVNATREDVAVMFGHGLQSYGQIKVNPTLAFNDSNDIALSSAPYVELLTALNIISGDNLGNFNPKNSINRAEMAVITSKSYDLMNTSQTKSIAGEITSVSSINSITAITVSSEAGSVSLRGNENVPVIAPDDNKMVLSQLVEGDEVLVTYSGEDIQSVLITATKTDSNNLNSVEKYPSVIGYFKDISKEDITIKVNGETKTYSFVDDDYKNSVFFVERYKQTFGFFSDEATNSKMVTLFFDSSGKVTQAKLVHMAAGSFQSITDSKIRLKIDGNIATFYFVENKKWLTFFYDDKEVSLEYIENNVEKGEDISVYLNEDSEVYTVEFKSSKSEATNRVEGKVKGVEENYIKIGTSNYSYYGGEIANVGVSVLDGSKTLTEIYSVKSGQDKEKEYYVWLDLDSNNKVTQITGYVTNVYGNLKKVLPTSGAIQVLTGTKDDLRIYEAKERGEEYITIGDGGISGMVRIDSIEYTREPVETKYYITSDTVFNLEEVEWDYPNSIDGLKQALDDYKEKGHPHIKIELELDSNGNVTLVKASGKW